MNLGSNLPGETPILPLAQLSTIAKIQNGSASVRPPEIGSKPQPDGEMKLPVSVNIKFTILEEPPPDRTHIPTSRIAFARLPDGKGTFLVQQYCGRTKSHESVWCKLPVFDLQDHQPDAELPPQPEDKK